MARFGKLNFAQKQCVAKAGLLMQRTAMLYAGARIGVAMSGGVDSMVLARVLTIRRAIVPFGIELMALHVDPGFDPALRRPLEDWCRQEGLALHVENTDIGPRAFSAENRKNSPCFFCSMHRRKRLFALCKRYRLSHLALGHNADDLLATFFMNMLQGGRVEGLRSSDDFFGGELKVVRPLLLLEKAVMIRAAKAWKLPVVENPCPACGQTRRAQVESWSKELLAHSPEFRRNAMAALTRWQLELDTPDAADAGAPLPELDLDAGQD